MAKNKKKRSLRSWAIFSGLGLQIGATVYLGNRLGRWLDTKFEKTFLENTLTILAVFLAMYAVVVQVNKFNKE